MISAIVLAAGKSVRMGSQKLLLPWGNTTVIGKVVTTILEAGLSSIYVVVGGNMEPIRRALSGYSINLVINPDFASGEMLSSVQVGLKSLTQETEAALIVLGDQPQIEANVARAIVKRYLSTKHQIVVPSFRMHRGHPWLVDKTLWHEINDLIPPDTLRDYLVQNQSKISYVEVDAPSILQDLDTPDDYQSQKP